jgi:hypothetical protein
MADSFRTEPEARGGFHYNITLKELSFKYSNVSASAVIFVLSLIYYLSYSNYGFSESDWGGIVIAAERFLQGDIFYKDISIVYTPGIYLYTALAFKLFGIKLSSATAAWSFIRAVNCVLFYLLGTKFFSKRNALLLTFILWFIPGPPHKSFLGFFCLLHLIILLKLLTSNNKGLYFLSGLIAGFSFVFRLDLLMLFALPLMLTDFLKLLNPVNSLNRKSQMTACLKNYPFFGIGMVIAILPLALYLKSNSALSDAVDQTLYFLGSAKSRMFLLPPLREIFSWSIWDFSNYAVVIIPVGIHCLFVVEMVRNIMAGRFIQDDKKVLILFLYGLLSLHQILRWPWAGRLFQILPPFIIIDIWLILRYYHSRNNSHKIDRFIYIPVAVMTNLLLVSMIMGSLTMGDMYTNGSILIRFNNDTFVSYPKASFYTTREEGDEVYKIIEIIETHTNKDEFIYIVQYYPMYYFITERKNATRYYFIEAYSYSEKRQYEVIREIEDKNVKFIISGPNHPQTPEAEILNEYLNNNFKIIDRVKEKLFYKRLSAKELALKKNNS